jgi:hypothetical protein
VKPRIFKNQELNAKRQKALEDKALEDKALRDHIEFMCTTVLSREYGDAGRLVLEYGRLFTGIPRPEGYHQGRAKNCFGNSQLRAVAQLGAYCEGFVFAPDVGHLLLHGWITPDGESAVDVTWQNAPECKYFGISFHGPALHQLAMTISLGKNRGGKSILSPPIDDRLINALSTLRSEGVI